MGVNMLRSHHEARRGHIERSEIGPTKSEARWPRAGQVDESIERAVWPNTSHTGFVTETVAGQSSAAKMVHDDLVCPPAVSPRDHQARRLALCALHAQLSRRRRFARGARSGYLLRNGAAMGFEVRTIVRQRTSPATPAPNDSVASRRDGRDDRRPAVLALARG